MEAEVLKQAEEVGLLFETIRKVERQVRWIRTGFALLILAIIIGWTMAIVSHVRKFDLDGFASEMSKKAEATWPVISNELDSLLKNVLPAAERAIEKEIEAAAPEITQKLSDEAQALEKALKSEIDVAAKRYLTVDARQGAITEIQKAFPQFSDATQVDKLAAALQESFILAAQQKLTDMVLAYYDTILGFEKAFARIRSDIPENQKPATLETVLSLWIEVIYEKMGGDEKLIPKTDSKSRR